MNRDRMEEINGELDTEEETGYYLRSKRRKLGRATDCSVSTSVRVHKNDVVKRKNPIMHVPTEVLQCVFRFMTYSELNHVVRRVNRRFKIIAEDLLNIAFKEIERKLQSLIKLTYDSLQYTPDDEELKCACKLLNILEMLNLQHSMTMATIWRFVYNDYYRTSGACMYGGLLIDLYKKFIWKFTHTPSTLYAAIYVCRDHSFPEEIARIVQLTKTFCVHFDKATEEPMSKSLKYSGCKIIDILECALFAQKTTFFERATSDAFMAKYSYFFNNAWFVALPIVPSKGMSWKQKQRMMHMRLRRVVLAHSDMYLEQAQYERELMLRSESALHIRKPGNNVYTGYGDVEDTFFFYGVMNDGAYIQKFIPEDNDEEDDEEDVDVPIEENNLNNPNNPNQIPNAPQPPDENLLFRFPHLGVRVDVTVRCPLSFAPQKFLEGKYEEKTKLIQKHRIKGPTKINMTFDCYGAFYPRLPTHYEYNFKPSRNM